MFCAVAVLAALGYPGHILVYAPNFRHPSRSGGVGCTRLLGSHTLGGTVFAALLQHELFRALMLVMGDCRHEVNAFDSLSISMNTLKRFYTDFLLAQ
ncbi:hypothetical protein ABN239_14110 [Providencia vermicola]|uniref:hypothetical protein n=1 Tax=Providencia vermicola TaxID=333965 RepID=UPI0032DB6C39